MWVGTYIPADSGVGDGDTGDGDGDPLLLETLEMATFRTGVKNERQARAPPTGRASSSEIGGYFYPKPITARPGVITSDFDIDGDGFYRLS
jgi:hypothetical protein